MNAPRSYPQLIHDLAVKYHEGVLLRMEPRAGVAASTLWRWIRGRPKSYNLASVHTLCQAYDLPFAKVMHLINRDTILRLSGKKIPLPDLSDIHRGALSRKEEKDRAEYGRSRMAPKLAGLLAAAALGSILGSGSAAAKTPPVGSLVPETAHYVNPRRRSRKRLHKMLKPRRRRTQESAA